MSGWQRAINSFFSTKAKVAAKFPPVEGVTQRRRSRRPRVRGSPSFRQHFPRPVSYRSKTVHMHESMLIPARGSPSQAHLGGSSSDLGLSHFVALVGYGHWHELQEIVPSSFCAIALLAASVCLHACHKRTLVSICRKRRCATTAYHLCAISGRTPVLTRKPVWLICGHP